MSDSSGKSWFVSLKRRLTRAKQREAKAELRARLARIDSRLAHLDGVRAQWELSVPQLLRYADEFAEFRVSSERTAREIWEAFGRVENELRSSIQQLWGRLDVVREEAMLEIRYGAHQVPSIPTKVVDPDKLAQLVETGLRLNLGCGHIPLEGYVNVDMRDLPGVDVVAPAGALPFEPETIQEIYSAHFLEHFPQEEFKRRLLPHWGALLAPGGVLRAVVPDGEAMFKGVADGSYPFEDFRAVLFGGQEYNGDFHFNMFTPQSLAALLRASGFVDVRCVESARRNGRCFEFEMAARKP